MKKLSLAFFLLFLIQNIFSQPTIDKQLPLFAAEKNENQRLELFLDFFGNTVESAPSLDFKNAQALLEYSQQEKDIVAEVYAYCQLGFNFRTMGSTENALRFFLKGYEKAQESDNEKLVAISSFYLSLYSKDIGDPTKALSLLKQAEELSAKTNFYRVQSWTASNLFEVYLVLNKTDSALFYAQKDYEISLKHHYYDFFSATLYHLGTIHGKLGNKNLALNYFDMAIAQATKINSLKRMNGAYNYKAEYLARINEKDSAMFCAKKAIAVVQHTPLITMSVKPAKLLLDMYRNTNVDSAFKYSEIFRMANDSLFNSRTVQRTQAMSFAADMRQQELAAEKLKEEEERKENIQYALIALGIVSVFILYLLLSRTSIINPKLIRFFGVIALLLVFEFLNLLLHPFLERVTHHSPVLMLLALVGIAALLVPLHHKLEKATIFRLVEKNKQIRLAAAKRTIEKLEKKGKIEA
jgi:tetratricopeptide (TPR) repeat protein